MTAPIPVEFVPVEQAPIELIGSAIRGETGPVGPIGPSGLGSAWVQDAGVPGASDGVDGDFYLDTATGNIYGPKADGAWGALIYNIAEGQQGPQGDPGLVGPSLVGVTLIDSTNPATIYVGKAPDGAVEADATWTVRRSTFDAAGVLTTTAVAVDVTWTGRTTHVYT